MAPCPRRPTALMAAAGLALGLALGGCAGIVVGEDGRVTGAQAAATPPAGVASAPATVRPGSGPAACTRPIADFERVLMNDQRIGHLNAFRHGSIMAELEPARSACAAGRAGDANRTLAAVRARHGYR